MEHPMFSNGDKGKTEGSSKVIVFPDFQKIKDNVEKLRTELSMLLLERDELQYVICKNIETAYCIKLGALEHRAYETECKFLRLKRKIELVQAKINRQEKVSVSQIELSLDDEFSEYQKKLNEQIEKMNKALERSKGRVLSDDETNEIKKLYRNVVKKLHPDLNPNITEAEIKLFQNAVSAFENGDIQSLRIINEMVGAHPLYSSSEDAIASLIEENKHMESMIKTVQENISAIKSHYPYTVKEIVENCEKEAQRRNELLSIIDEYEEGISAYESRLTELLR